MSTEALEHPVTIRRSQLPDLRGWRAIPPRLLAGLSVAGIGREDRLGPAAALVWARVALADGGGATGSGADGVVWTLAQLAAQLGRAGTPDSGRKLGRVVDELVDAGWLTRRRTRHGTCYTARRRVDLSEPGRDRYAVLRRDDLDRIGQPLDYNDPTAGTVTEAHAVAWARWQTVLRRDRVRVSLPDLAGLLGCAESTVKLQRDALVAAGWLAVDPAHGEEATYWLAELDPATTRDLTRRPRRHPADDGHIHPADDGHIPPSSIATGIDPSLTPPSRRPAAPVVEPATREGSTPPEPTPNRTARSGPSDVGATAATIGRIVDAAVQAHPTPLGRAGISRRRLADRLHTSGILTTHTERDIVAHLTRNPGGIRDPLSVLLARIDSPPPTTRHTPEPLWCGRCDRIARLAAVGTAPDGSAVLARCSACGGGSAAASARAVQLTGGTPTPPATTIDPPAAPLPAAYTSRYHWVQDQLRRTSGRPAPEGGESAPDSKFDQPSRRWNRHHG